VIRKTGYFAALLALVVLGCAGHDALSVKGRRDGKTFWTHRYQYVRLVPQDRCQGQDTPANIHPQELGGRLRTILESLRVDLPEREKTVPVFTRAELELVTEPLVQAFRKAAPDEDVALVVEGMHPGKYGLERCIITARLFVQNGDELHVIFGKLHVPVDADLGWNVEPPDHRLKYREPGSRCQKTGEIIPAIVATHSVTFHEQEGTPRKNWLVVNLAAQPQPPGEAVPVPVAMPAAPQPPTVTAPAATPQPQTVTAPPAASQPRAVTPPPPVRDSNRMTPPPVQGSQKSVLERLQILKDLRVKGLITEQEYLDKKKEILDSL
jgi:hypothetical protein